MEGGVRIWTFWATMEKAITSGGEGEGVGSR